MKANCYDCKYRGEVPGSAHSSCYHPLVAEVTKGDKLPMLKLFAGFFAPVGRAPPIQIRRDELHIVGHPHGIAHGWFQWPYNFDPLWLENCDGYHPKNPFKLLAWKVHQAIKRLKRWGGTVPAQKPP